jgi:hypothetical protein
MEVKYRNTFGELIWFQFYQVPRLLSMQIATGVIVLIIGYRFFRRWSDLGYSLAVQIILFIVILFVFLVILVLFLLTIFVFLQLTSQHQRSQINQACKLVVSKAGLINESPVSRTEIAWSGIWKVSQTRNIILIYLSERSAFLISKKCFPNESEAQSFFNYTFDLWKSSKQGR